MALALRERTFELLQSMPGQRFKAREIAEWIHSNYAEETSGKMNRSTFIEVNSLTQKNRGFVALRNLGSGDIA